MSKIVEFRLGKGVTRKVVGTENDFNKRYLEFTVRLPERYTEEDLHVALARTEYLADNYLVQPEAPQIPQFNSEELIKHLWKGKKDGKGGYLKGSAAWGWDFKDQFSEDTIRALEKTKPLVIDEYEFTLGETIIQAKKKKD